MDNPYKKLDETISRKISEDKKEGWSNPFKFNDDNAIRRDMSRDKQNIWRTPFVRDTEKILHLPVYNRYADKTQVFSFYKNDDITRRALHVQIVSRIARTIGNVLGLNLDLIESIALGHDIGHTPFGHVGEKFLSKLLYDETGLYFNHNVHSVRVLDTIFHRNITLQTLDGILCHNGEFELKEYRPLRNTKSYNFTCFDQIFSECCKKGEPAIKHLVPTTLEACVVRVCDMIAYVGKDRQDALTAQIITQDEPFTKNVLGNNNATIINNLTVDIINNSYGQDYIMLSPEYFQALKTAKKENYQKIYLNPKLSNQYNESIEPMFKELFYKLIDDVKKNNKNSIIWKHHINFIQKNTASYSTNSSKPSEVNADNKLEQIIAVENGFPQTNYSENKPELIAADFIASMTDDYFVDLYRFLFPNSKYKIEYKSYFDK